MNDNFLIVYNTCEIRGNNLFWYIDCLKNLLNQKYDNFKIVVSGCMLTNSTKIGLQKTFGNSILYNFIDDLHTVNVTFNHTIKTVTETIGNFDGYIYVDSGMNTENQTNILKEINLRSQTKKYGMITVQSSNDTGYEGWFGKTETYTFKDQDFIIPVGKCCNLHMQYFNDVLFKFYNGLMPDIFKAFCTESVFSFLNAALNLKWIIMKDIAVFHNKAADGPVSGFSHVGNSNMPWNNLLGNLKIEDVLINDYAKSLGMGYEEYQGIMIHNPNLFTEDGFAKNPELKNFIKKNLFVPPSIVNYKNIKHTLII
jgi:hypothetical protein